MKALVYKLLILTVFLVPLSWAQDPRSEQPNATPDSSGYPYVVRMPYLEARIKQILASVNAGKSEQTTPHQSSSSRADPAQFSETLSDKF